LGGVGGGGVYIFTIQGPQDKKNSFAK